MKNRFYGTASASLVFFGAALLTCGDVRGQAIELHQAPGLRSEGAPLLIGPQLELNDDPTPLGFAVVNHLILLGEQDALAAPDRALVVDLARIKAPQLAALTRRLKRLVGKPVSRKLLSQIEAVIASHYRRIGQPFVSVTLPPQEITQGVVQLRVTPFRLSKISISGARKDEAMIAKDISAAIGEPIKAPRLAQDLNWLNHSPFRDSTAVFTQGANLGDTELTVESHESKRWQVASGYSNSGSQSSGYDRYMLSGEIGDLLIPDSLLSFSVTASDDVWGKQGYDPLNDKAPNRYLSHSLVMSAPLGVRQDLTVMVNAVHSYSSSYVFDVKSETDEYSGVYRTALSNISSLPGDLSLGVEARIQIRNTLYGSISVLKQPIGVFQELIGWSDNWYDGANHHSLSATLRFSPRGLGGRFGDAAYARFTQGRVNSAGYAYLQANYGGEYALPRGMQYVTQVQAQYSNAPLMATEQIALGGGSSVRGYSYDDQSFDKGLVWRNELRVSPMIINTPFLAQNLPRITNVLAPYAFVDGGYVQNYRAGRQYAAYSSGVGADARLGAHVTAGVTAAWALRAASYTRSGSCLVLAHINLAY